MLVSRHIRSIQKAAPELTVNCVAQTLLDETVTIADDPPYMESVARIVAGSMYVGALQVSQLLKRY